MTFSLGSAKASLLVGGKSGDGSLYARDASKPLVMTLDATLLDDFKKGADDYRKKELFAFRAYDANRIEITRGGQTVAFDKIKGAKPADEDKWQRAGSGGARRDADKERDARPARQARASARRRLSGVDRPNRPRLAGA